MCGRYSLSASPEEVKALFDYAEQPNFPPRYNIAPTQPIALVKHENGGRHFGLARWGLVPSWVKDPASFTLLLNARAETLEEKPSFRAAVRHRRCLIPANGFYEWQRKGAAKQPYWIAPADGRLLAFAGLWETYSHPDGGDIDTAAVITVEANGTVKPVHHRMPAIIPPEHFNDWLSNGTVMSRDAVKLLQPVDDGLLIATPISTRVNSVTNDDPSLWEREVIPTPPKPLKTPAKPKPQKKVAGGSSGNNGQLDLF
ncbi:Putative SOS response-associated peptidase YedK [Pseudovibrio ascidiaceicola]|uniref:Abasic site processing protein n=1 Tax=Pseudovibrio ascidiaceicola TaxID=285279 RepID=A0A1I3WTM6_9HYPH|nr:SOS response-associated peptidase [Pseudovibrio ascidiaceicola]SFK10994.1 Putative SOS response-associated peptidase YedK [Pseudovibrio ascidiaceicola]